MLEMVKDMLLPLALPAVLLGIHFYFQTRQSRPVGRVERILATVWLWVRCIVCFGAAGLCVFGALFAIYDAVANSVSLTTLAGVVLSLAMAALFFHWGRYGAGYSRADLSEDRPVHEARRKRYGWRW